jgi:hypothetical protein
MHLNILNDGYIVSSTAMSRLWNMKKWIVSELMERYEARRISRRFATHARRKIHAAVCIYMR